MGDAGLSGRKIIVDTYGGMAPPRRRQLQRQGSDQGRSLRRLHGPLRRQERGRGRPGTALRGAAGLRHRCRPSAGDECRDVRNRRPDRARPSPISWSGISTCARRRSSPAWTCADRSIDPPRPTAISGAPTSTCRGSAPIAPRRCATWPPRPAWRGQRPERPVSSPSRRDHRPRREPPRGGGIGAALTAMATRLRVLGGGRPPSRREGALVPCPWCCGVAIPGRDLPRRGRGRGPSGCRGRCHHRCRARHGHRPGGGPLTCGGSARGSTSRAGWTCRDARRSADR